MLNNIRGKSIYFESLIDNIEDEANYEDIGMIYPILIKNYDDFQEYNKLLYVSKQHFGENEFKLLDLVLWHLDSGNEELSKEEKEKNMRDRIGKLEKLFSLILRKKILFYSNEEVYLFKDIENKISITKDNYDELRKFIMWQNLMFEQKVYRDPLMQEYVDMAMEAKMRNAPKIGIEEMLSTVSINASKHYWDLDNYSIYQVYSDFYRIRKDKSYSTSILFRSQGSDVSIEDFAEDLDIYKNPYDDLFVTDIKLGQLDSSLG